MVSERTRVRRISAKLNKVLDGLKSKNKIKFVEASDIVADSFTRSVKKNKIVESIRRELEF